MANSQQQQASTNDFFSWRRQKWMNLQKKSTRRETMFHGTVSIGPFTMSIFWLLTRFQAFRKVDCRVCWVSPYATIFQRQHTHRTRMYTHRHVAPYHTRAGSYSEFLTNFYFFFFNALFIPSNVNATLSTWHERYDSLAIFDVMCRACFFPLFDWFCFCNAQLLLRYAAIRLYSLYFYK